MYILILSLITIFFVLTVTIGLIRKNDELAVVGIVVLLLIGGVGWGIIGGAAPVAGSKKETEQTASVIHDGPYIHLSVSNEVIMTIKDAAPIERIGDSNKITIYKIDYLNAYGYILRTEYTLR